MDSDDCTPFGLPVENTVVASRIRKVGREQALPLSFVQQWLWSADQIDPSAVGRLTVGLRLQGELNRQALFAALDRIVARHEILRTTFRSVESEPAQVIGPRNRGFSLTEQNVGGHWSVEQIARQDACNPFDLTIGPLIRGQLLRVSEREHVLVIVQHPTISDNWSTSVLIREVCALYSSFVLGQADPLPPLELQYADYACWQRQRVTAAVIRNQLEFWTRSLSGTPESLQLPTDRPRPAVPCYAIDRVQLRLSPELTNGLRRCARYESVSLFATLLSGWALLLGRFSGQHDVVICTSVVNRPGPDAGPLVGPFENTAALRVRLQEGQTINQLLTRTMTAVANAHSQTDLPFEQVMDALKSVLGGPLHQARFALRPAMATTGSGELQLSGLKLVEMFSGDANTKFQVSLSLIEGDDDLTGALEYASDLFERETIERMAASWKVLLENMVIDTRQPISRVPLMTAVERDKLLYRFNHTSAAYPEKRVIHELFEEQVVRTPEAVAAVYEDDNLTYDQLNKKANQLARFLRAQGMQMEEYVPILMPRCHQMLIAQLAVLKSGGVYVPVDRRLPLERQEFMIRDCGARRVLAEAGVCAGLERESIQWIDCTQVVEALGKFPVDNLRLQMDVPPPAYVMYTSGSTGAPKGVLVPHRAVNRLVINNGYAQIEPADCIAHCSNPAFDASTFEIWGALLNGAKMLIVRQEVVLEASRLAEVLTTQGVTILWMTIGLFAQYTDALGAVFARLRYLLVGGDVVDPGTVRRVMRDCSPRHLLSAYGPTECTTFSTTYAIQAVADDAASIPIGGPISNAQIYILDSHGQPVPIGVAGEIYIGGAGVAFGYLNRPELTAERFVTDPFGADPKARLYKSGDVGKWRSDGNIEFLGRNDQQVKLRGFRIELGEIEAQLARHALVKEALVVAREDAPGEKRLVAYFTQRYRSVPTVEDLRAHLKAVLPEYMVPSAFVMMEILPLTSNGKVDRRSLPVPQLQAYATRQYEAPRGEIEALLAGIWRELLRVERVGRDDNFFELGGHSLLMPQMMERLRRVGQSAEVRNIYVSPTLADLARTLISEAGGQFGVPPNLIPLECDAITPEMLPLVELEAQHIERIVQAAPGGAANIQDIYPLAPLQEGILFHHLLDLRRGDTYVLPTVVLVSSRERLEELVAALQRVIDRHDVLRTAVLWEGLPRPVQVVYRHVTLPVEEVSLNWNRDPTEQIKEWMNPDRQRMDLRQAPLMRLRVAADVKSGQWYALLKSHHIICDHVAEEVVVSEVRAHLEGRAQTLPEAVPYRSHVAQALARADADDVETFFRRKLEKIDEPTAPFGLLDVRADGSQIEEARDELEPALAQRVRIQARRLEVSAATLFHAAWGLVVARTSGRNDVVFGTLLLGRLQGEAGAKRTLGLFINTLPLRLQIKDVSAELLVKQTQRELVELLAHEQASLAVAQRCSGIAGTAPLFSALLNYRHSAPNPEAEWAAGIRVVAAQELTNYPITVSVDDFGKGFALTAQTERRIDPHRVTGYLSTAMRSLVEALELAPQTPATALSILPESERRQVIEVFNPTHAIYPKENLIHELFEQQVRRTPDAVAVVYQGKSLTYAELNGKANQLARYLRKQGVSLGQLVAICAERSVELVVSVLGTLKAGGAYVPLDPAYPSERLAYMLRDARPRVLLIQELLRERLPDTAAKVIALDTDWIEITLEIPDNVNVGVPTPRSHQLAYVIYTSGSTGEPKGVMVEHGNVTRLFSTTERLFNFNERDVWTLFHSFAFDFSVWELWGALLYGGRVVVVPFLTARSPQDFYSLVSAEGITVLNNTPSAFAQLIDAQAEAPEKRHSLRVVIFGGEALELRTLRPWLKRNGAIRPELVNMYGITETTVHVTYRLLGEEDIESEGQSLVGKPIPDLRAYLLDRHGQPVPIGVAGEIHVGGAGVSRGYLNRPELTAERFVGDPFCVDPKARLYKTGDVGRWRADGTLEYLGRNDDQVKIRGYRIELGEIEAQLVRHDRVKEAVVVARQDGPGKDKRLVAYVTQLDRSDMSVDDLRAHLKSVLPDYMVPSAFVVLESLPLTANGKLDRRALPAPERGAYATRDYEAPRGEVEGVLANIWRDLLRVERVGRRDNFFDLGGHSLLASRVITHINHALEVDIPLHVMFEDPTIETLSSRVVREIAAELSMEAP